jgi:hypothetical protein
MSFHPKKMDRDTLLGSLDRLAGVYEQEAKEIRTFADSIREVSDLDLFVDSSIEARVTDLIMSGFNTSNKVSPARTAVLSAARLARLPEGEV